MKDKSRRRLREKKTSSTSNNRNRYQLAATENKLFTCKHSIYRIVRHRQRNHLVRGTVKMFQFLLRRLWLAPVSLVSCADSCDSALDDAKNSTFLMSVLRQQPRLYFIASQKKTKHREKKQNRHWKRCEHVHLLYMIPGSVKINSFSNFKVRRQQKKVVVANEQNRRHV